MTLNLEAQGSAQSASEQQQGSRLLGVMAEWSGQPEQNIKIAKLKQQQSSTQAQAVHEHSREGGQQQQRRALLQTQQRRRSLVAALGRSGGSGRGLLSDLEGPASSASAEVQEVTNLEVRAIVCHFSCLLVLLYVLHLSFFTPFLSICLAALLLMLG